MVWSDKSQLFMDLCKHLSHNPKVASADVLNSKDGNSKYCKITMKSGKSYGFSYLPQFDLYELWSKWGQHAPHDEQTHQTFNTVCEFAEWFYKSDIDKYEEQCEAMRSQAKKEVDAQRRDFFGEDSGDV